MDLARLRGRGGGSSVRRAEVGTGSSASGGRNALTLTFNMSIKAAFAGNRAFCLAARDAAEHNSGWQALGTWKAP